MGADPRMRLRENATEVTATLVTGIWLAAMFTGQGWWLAALLFGYVVVVPMVALLFGDEDDVREWWTEDEIDPETLEEAEAEEPSATDALERLRDRYAAGELTDEQFERKLDRLLETESLEDADRWRRERRNERESTRDRDLEYER
ncbi:SHOCT domain-containing protein [Natronococcus sp. A-GB7]|uniref:SHOCT domain-containing protein n=1 Tax=Natronococcus sp. A-GB7 TaxID=3037649 RepID=UPI00241EAD43|nr:SHOCT domain-containing protein [Natronococcus sp. A-GB7]MDG5818695.1 SHOCT domain-containing protein [Natronococcus sp. A-GB7]